MCRHREWDWRTLHPLGELVGFQTVMDMLSICMYIRKVCTPYTLHTLQLFLVCSIYIHTYIQYSTVLYMCTSHYCAGLITVSMTASAIKFPQDTINFKWSTLRARMADGLRTLCYYLQYSRCGWPFTDRYPEDKWAYHWQVITESWSFVMH